VSDGPSTGAADDTPSFRPPVVAAVRERLEALDRVADRAFVGPPIAGLPLRPLELGELYPDLEKSQATWNARSEFAQSLRRASSEAGFECVLVGEAAMRAFQRLPFNAVAPAIKALALVAGEPSEALRDEARRILGKPATVRVLTPGLVALARVAGPQWLDPLVAYAGKYESSPLRRAEFEVLPRLSVAALAAFDAAGDWYSPAFESIRADPAAMLAGEPAYLEFGQAVFEMAAERLDALHDGRLAYEADKVFTVDEGQVLARAARVAAKHDAPWLRTLIGRVLPRVSVAPTAAKTLPSQSVAIALGYAVQTDPTPEGVQALRDTLATIRHAGVEKKLARNLKPAERGLAARPEVALRMLVDAKADKKRQAFVATCLEATWWTGGDWPLAQWRTGLADTPNGAPFASGLLWRVASEGAAPRVLRVETSKKDGLHFVDVDGRQVEPPADARVALWHPLQSGADERAAWQRVVAARRLRQPLRQVFRETYEPEADERDAEATQEFAGHELALRPLIGLARREGWSFDFTDSGMTRQFGDLRAWFAVQATLFPGAAGHAPSGELRFGTWRDRRWRAVPLAAVAPVLLSEACRAVDLLVSVSAFAVDDRDDFGPLTAGDLGVRLAADKSPVVAPARAHPGVARRDRLHALGQRSLGAMAEMRRRALELALAPHIDAGRVAVEARHVRVGDATVHLATGRVVENGAALEFEAPVGKAALAAVPWLPYDEVLLQRIADNVAALLARGSA
jgi:hypothetical protein